MRIPMMAAALLALSCKGADDVKETGEVPTDDTVSESTPPDDTEDTEDTQDTEDTEDTGPFDRDGDGVVDAEDCAPDDATVFPGNTEDCDGVDDDCDGAVDEGATSTFYTDGDGDGYGDPSSPVEACEAGEDTVADGTDCNDADETLFPEADGACAPGGTCAEIFDAGLSTGDGVYTVDTDGSGGGLDPVSVYCDMTGGGWMLVGRQIPAEQLTRTVDDIHLDETWDPDGTHRWGNARVQSLSPTAAWRITSNEASDGSLRDDAWFQPTCVIDWDVFVGTFQDPRVHDDDCGVAYTDATLTTPLSGHTENNCSLGIGQNNSGNYCSIRMGSCNCFNATCNNGTWADEEGVAAPCAFQEWQDVVMSLWVL
ncbi:MAG: hypothetical protein H6739_27170 [Alphaproteobacteria bacterium]|nr:hypothetical protein [Alphaproteobacteria bacterium]